MTLNYFSLLSYYTVFLTMLLISLLKKKTWQILKQHKKYFRSNKKYICTWISLSLLIVPWSLLKGNLTHSPILLVKFKRSSYPYPSPLSTRYSIVLSFYPHIYIRIKKILKNFNFNIFFTRVNKFCFSNWRIPLTWKFLEHV